jgi:arsenate reductase
MIKVLFVCVHNAARSQMAEAYLNVLGKGYFQAESAGLEPGVLNPDVVKVMAEDGYDLRLNLTKSVFDFYKEGKRYHYVVKVCDAINGQKCPIFPSTLETLEWNHEDPASFTGSEEDRLNAARKIRDDIKNNVQRFVDGILLSEVRAKADELSWIPTQDPVGYRLSSILHETKSEIGVSRSWLKDSNYIKQVAWIEALVNLLYLEFGKSMLSELHQERFTSDQLEGWMRTIIRRAALNPAKPMDVRQFESILHAQYEVNQSHVRLMTHTLQHVQTQQVLVDMLMKAIQDKRLIIWLGHEDAGILLGLDGNEQGPLNLHVLRKGQIESRSIAEWISQASEQDALVLLERK